MPGATAQANAIVNRENFLGGYTQASNVELGWGFLRHRTTPMTQETLLCVFPINYAYSCKIVLAMSPFIQHTTSYLVLYTHTRT